MVSCVDCVDWPREFAREDTGLSVRVCVIHVRGLLLADTLVVPLATEQTMNDHDWVALCFAVVVVEFVRKINHAQAGRRVK